LRTTRSQLKRIVRDIHHNNFVKFNVHSRLQGLGLQAQQKLTSAPTGIAHPSHSKSPLHTTRSQLERIVRDIHHNNFI
jgi:hypothetical protein